MMLDTSTTTRTVSTTVSSPMARSVPQERPRHARLGSEPVSESTQSSGAEDHGTRFHYGLVIEVSLGMQF